MEFSDKPKVDFVQTKPSNHREASRAEGILWKFSIIVGFKESLGLL